MVKGVCMFCGRGGEGFGAGAICRSCAAKAKLTVKREDGWTMVYATIGLERRLVQEFDFRDGGDSSLVAAASAVILRAIARGQRSDGPAGGSEGASA